jgi:Tfp pilus assembly protein PilF
MCYRGRVVRFLRFLMLAGALAVALAACGTGPRPITKLVGGRQITTRSVDPEAYEHVSRALLYEDQEQWQKAADELRRALVLDAEAPELHAQLAELLLRLGDTKAAAGQAHASLKIAPTARGLLALAHVRQAAGDAAGVVEALRRATAEVEFQAEDDVAEEVYLELADAQLQVLDVPAARSTLATLTMAEPGSAAGRMRLMAIHWAEGDMARAEAQLRAALAEEPNQIEALVALAWIEVATGRQSAARKSFREALDRSEGALEIAAAFARFLVGIGNTKEAEQLADDLAVPQGSLDRETIAGQVELERSARRLDRALALLDHAREQGIGEDEKTRLSLTRAAILKEQGKTALALSSLLAVSQGSPLYFEARLRAAELLRDGGKAAEAARTVEEALPLASGDRDTRETEAAVSLALIEEKRGDAAAAVRRLEKRLAGHTDDSRLVIALAAIEERRENWRHALDLVDRWLTKHPASVEALNFWGFVAADHTHALELANQRLQVANALEPGSGGLIDSLGWVRFRRKDSDRAAMFLEQAARLEPSDPEIQWHLGEVYAERKEGERAAATFRRALTLGPDDRLRRKVEDSLARLLGRKVSGR